MLHSLSLHRSLTHLVLTTAVLCSGVFSGPDFTSQAETSLWATASQHQEQTSVVDREALVHSTLSFLAHSTPIGWFDSADTINLFGWVCDPGNPSRTLDVHFYATGVFVNRIGSHLITETGAICSWARDWVITETGAI